MAYKGIKVKTKVGDLKYVFIKGEGRNQERDPNKDPRMQYTASLCVPKDGDVHKAFLLHIEAEWKKYKEHFGVKGRPDTNGIKEELIKDPKGTIDPETEEVKKISTGNVLINFKTNTKWPPKDGETEGAPQVVKVFDGKGNDITATYNSVDWGIGEGSTGIIHGSAVGNNVGGNHKVTLYLSAVQIAKLVKWEGDAVDAEEIEDAEELDLGDDGVAAISEDEKPDL